MKGACPDTDHAASRTVAAHVHALRTTRGWSLRALERLTETAGRKVGYATISRIEASRDADRRPHAVSVDDLVALAAAFNVSPARLLAAPDCFACMDNPPTGFTCRACGTEA